MLEITIETNKTIFASTQLDYKPQRERVLFSSKQTNKHKKKLGSLVVTGMGGHFNEGVFSYIVLTSRHVSFQMEPIPEFQSFAHLHKTENQFSSNVVLSP